MVEPMNLLLDFAERTQSLSGPRGSGIDAAIAQFQHSMQQDGSPIRAIRHQPAQPGQFVSLPEQVDPEIARALANRGIEKLYSHQAKSYEITTAGKNVVVVTPTASGKTLCYNLPVFHFLRNEPNGRAFYLFPTKALAEDQRQEFQRMSDELGGGITAFTYDGDTPKDARKTIRERANVVLTNPDMLHTGILPHHTKWAKCFENLKYFVIDELHYYRGVYGSHLANVIRRLKRICAFYGSNPIFICCSATIGNPKELAESLVEQPFECVEENGAPSGEKYFVFYNPPVVNRQLGIRRSYLHETRRIAEEFIHGGQQTLVFANSRLATEVLVTYLKDSLSHAPFSNEAVRGYRGGYLSRERREIEQKLRDGKIRAVVATNALELGVDIGSLDAVVMAGYPGSIASTWQRAGRSGRRQNTSLAVMVASSAPVDQYVVEHPEYFFGKSPEQAHVNPDNLEILLSHLKCAAFELPIHEGEKFGSHETRPMCEFLADDLKLLHRSADSWHWVSDSYPSDAVSLRSVTSDNFVIVDITANHKVIGETDYSAALKTLYEKAIYLHDSRQYQVETFDYEGRKAYVRLVDSDYFTDAIVYTQVKELARFDEAAAMETSPVMCAHGEVRVKQQVVGFKKIKFYTLENVGAGQLSLPEQEMHTTAFWLHFPAEFLAGFADFSSTEKQAGLVGLGNLMQTVGSLLLMSDSRDLGVAFTEDVERGAGIYEPDLFLYDSYPGGIGQSQPLFEMRQKLLEGALELVQLCPCEAGCPSCVGPEGEIGQRGKEVARRMLEGITLKY